MSSTLPLTTLTPVSGTASDRSFIRLADVHKTYRLGEALVPALRGITLDLRRGEFTALVGASGSGKSTLLNMVGCIDEPDRGSVVVEGRDVAHLSDDQRSQLRNEKIGFIFQSFNLIPVLDVAENVELPLLINQRIPAGERRDRVMQAIRDVELEEFVRHVPDKLSGGQRQRVAIARALVTSPLLVLADEPTANLDSATTHRIIDLMLALNASRGVTFFFSTHDEKLIARVARVVHISDGLIVDDSGDPGAGGRPEAR
jgi:putative ABC transport system ATP-binding protein